MFFLNNKAQALSLFLSLYHLHQCVFILFLFDYIIHIMKKKSEVNDIVKSQSVL